MAGKPSSFTTNMGNKICERIAKGESLRAMCEDEDEPLIVDKIAKLGVGWAFEVLEGVIRVTRSSRALPALL